MTLLSTSQPELATRALLRVRRTGIEFHNLSRDRVRIEIQVENRGNARSQPTRMHVETAPFGAFLRRQPLVTLEVPAIEPGASLRVETEAQASRPRPLAGFRSLLPPTLRTTTGAGDERAPDRVTVTARRNFVGMLFNNIHVARTVPPDLNALLENEQLHWAGNLHVWIGNDAVERHLAPRMRIHPGRVNLAEFCVGDRRDAYAFRVEGLGADCLNYLWDFQSAESIPWSPSGPWREPNWYEAAGGLLLLFVVRPPADFASSLAQVHVLQRSTTKTAIVEFDFDPSAAGKGCILV